MSKYARRKDRNHTSLQNELERMGFVCKDVSRFSGLGCDLLVKRMNDPDGNVWLVEVKSPEASKKRKEGTESEKQLGTEFPERYRILMRSEDAMEVLK